MSMNCWMILNGLIAGMNRSYVHVVCVVSMHSIYFSCSDMVLGIGMQTHTHTYTY